MNNKISVLYFVDCLEHGGIQSLLLEIVKHLHNNLDISFLVFESDKKEVLEDVMASYGCTIYKIPSLVKHPLKCFHACDKIFKNHHFDILHCHSSSKSAIPLKAAKKNNVKVRIEHVHSDRFQTNNFIKILFGKMLINPTCKYANYYMACSNSASKWMFKKKYIKTNKPIIIKNAIEINRFAYNTINRNAIRKQYGIDKNQFVVGHIGRFIEVKNHYFLLDVFKEVLMHNNNSCLLLVGVGPLMEKVKEKARRLGIIEKIIFANYQDDTSKFYSAFDVFVLPSLFEGLPFVGIEAQAAGLLCYFSSNVSSEVVVCHKQSFFLDLKDSPKLWANKIIENGLNHNREESSILMKNAGYEINEVTNRLYEFYLKNLNL